MINIVIIDDHESDLNRIHTLLSSQHDFQITGLGRDGYESLKMVAVLRPDIIVLDMNLEYINGAEMACLLKRKSPASSIILFTASEHDEYIRRAIGNEVDGYLLKNTDLGKLSATIRYISKGGHYITPKIIDKALGILSVLTRTQDTTPAAYHFQNVPGSIDPAERFPRGEKPASSLTRLSETETLVMGFLGLGWSTKRIAEKLHLKYGTVRNCISSAMRKTGLHNRTEAALFALQNGLAGQIYPGD